MADQSSTPSAREFGAAFKSFLEQSVGEAPATESDFAARIRAHLDADPATLPIVSDVHEVTDQPNLQLAMDDWLGGPGRSSEALGVSSEYKRIGWRPPTGSGRGACWPSSAPAWPRATSTAAG
jgi:hypothetical protein